MNAQNRIFNSWLIRISSLALVFVAGTVLFRPNPAILGSLFLAAALAGFLLLWLGVYLLAREGFIDNRVESGEQGKMRLVSDFLQPFLSRSANMVTAVRLLMVLSGVFLVISGIRTGAILIAAGYLFDMLDGALARREFASTSATAPSFASRLGPGFDAESDALALFLSGWALFALGEASALALLPASARYAFAPVFVFLPGEPSFPLWYRLYSKSAAAVFQFWISASWFAYAFGFPPAFRAVLDGPALITVSALIILSFTLETLARLHSSFSKAKHAV